MIPKGQPGSLDKAQRIQSALRGEPVDQVPLSLWRHFHREDRTPSGLAAATLALASEYDLDLVKLTPSGLYAVEDWGDGHIVYPSTDHDPPFIHAWAVGEAREWQDLPILPPTAGALGRELAAIRLVAQGLAGGTPLLMTIYSPLTLAFKLAGERVIEHLRVSPVDVHAGLATISQTVAAFAQAALDAGANGLFFATQLASSHWLTPAEYTEFGQRYDLAVLNAVALQSAVTVLHLHGRDLFFDLVNRYPVHAVSWHNHKTDPGLAEARQRTDRAFVTGLDRDLLDSGPVSAIEAQVHEALDQTKARGLILAPCCVIPTTAPAEHLCAARRALQDG